MLTPLVRYLTLAALCGAPASAAFAQVSASDLLVRLEQIEAHVRQLTGQIEQLQFRNQQLDQQVRRLQEDAEARFQELGSRARPPQQPARPGAVAPPPPPASPPSGRRSDVFEPNEHPDAPGAPRPLGFPGQRSDAAPAATASAARPAGAIPADAPAAPGAPAIMSEEPQVGAPGGRGAEAPLDLSTLARAAARDPAPAGQPASQGGLPPPRAPSAPGATATLPPAQTPRDEFDLAYGYLLRKDYALAEESLRSFMKKYPGDRLAADAQFWLGESMYQRQSFRDAADAFLTMTKRYESHSKAPDALLRLGQSLAALNERELACATLGEVLRKYPRAPSPVKQMVEREQRRVRC